MFVFWSTQNNSFRINQNKAVYTLQVTPDNTQPFISLWGAASVTTAQSGQRVMYKTKSNGWSDWQELKQDEHSHEEGKMYFIPHQIPNNTKKIKIKMLGQKDYLSDFKITLYYPNSQRSTANGQQPSANSQHLKSLQDSCFCPIPNIQYRNDWCPGNNCPQPTYSPTTTTNVIVHHSAGSNSSPDWAATVRSIWNFHVNTRGWSDIGYNYLIDPNGVIYEGRGEDVIGAHFSCMNTNTMGICLLGNFTSYQPTQASLDSLQKLIAWKLCKMNESAVDSTYHNLSQMLLANISGHRDGNSSSSPASCASGTTCPGNQLYNKLVEIRNETDTIQQICTNGEPNIIISSMNFIPESGNDTAYVGEQVDLFVSIGNTGTGDIKDSVAFTHRIGLFNPIDTDYIDTLNAGQIRSYQHNNYVFTAPGTFQYCVFVDPAPLEQNTVNNSFCINVPVINAPPCNIDAQITENACLLSSVVTNPAGNVSYQWYLNGAPLSGETDSMLNSVYDGNIMLVVTDNICSDTSNSINTLCAPCGLGVQISENNCALTSSITNQTGSVSYQWLLNGSALLGETSSSLTSAYNGNVSLIVTDNKCSDTSNIIYTNCMPCTISASISENSCIVSSTVTNNVGNVAYQWHLDGVPIQGETNASLSSSYNGNIMLVVTDSFCVDTSNSITTACAPCLFQVTINETTSCNLQANITGGTPTALQWYYNNTPISGATSTTYSADSNGLFYIVISDGFCTDTSNYLNLFCEPCNITATIAAVDTCFYQANLTGGIADAYQWLNNNTPLLGETMQGFQPFFDGNVSVIITSNHCTDTSNAFTVECEPCSLSASINQTGPCSLQASVAGNTSNHAYQWLLDSNLIQGETDSVITAQNNGSYSVIISADGCVDTSNAIFLNCAPCNIVASISETSPCNYQANLSGGVADSYQWLINGNPISGAMGSTFQPLFDGTVSVIISSGNCIDTSDVLTVDCEPCQLLASINQLDDCNLEAITTGNTSNNTYQWLFNNTPLSGETNVFLNAENNGIYSVVISGDGCVDTSNAINLNCLPCTIMASISENNCVLNATVSGINGSIAYQWLLDNNAIMGANQSNYISEDNGLMSLIVTDDVCSDTSNVWSVNCEPTGIQLLTNLGIDVMVFNGNIAVLNKHNRIIQLRILNVIGQEITQVNSRQTNINLNLNYLASGVYALQLVSENQEIVKTFVVH